ncbi:SPARC-related modular calcium-binding protein 2-like isoform X2 [Branchiostoma lanceolatum]|uniref:SPARC-related modular calcium-binding protein 2-like isoform X2 n=1 Tax=Branchiostoma lanceolatum TaxID=7740 RepID=UPI003452098E
MDRTFSCRLLLALGLISFVLAGTSAQTRCLEEKAAAEAAGPMLVGVFAKQCAEDGSYETTQCHGSTGYCYCARPDTGEVFQETAYRAWQGPQHDCGSYWGTRAQTRCLEEKAVAEAGPMLVGAFVKQCAEDGSYETTQCHGSTGYCYCARPDTGEVFQETAYRAWQGPQHDCGSYWQAQGPPLTDDRPTLASGPEPFTMDVVQPRPTNIPSPAAGSLDDILNCAEEITNCTAPALQTITRIFAPGAPQPGEAELKQLCMLYPQMDTCVKEASRTMECLATGQDQYAQYKEQASAEPPEVCAEYANVAGRCRLCMDVLFGALLTVMLVGWRG